MSLYGLKSEMALRSATSFNMLSAVIHLNGDAGETSTSGLQLKMLHVADVRNNGITFSAIISILNACFCFLLKQLPKPYVKSGDILTRGSNWSDKIY